MKKIRSNSKYDRQGKAYDRKGVGMELALLVILAVFACSTLLVSSALIGKDTLMREEAQLKTRLTLDALAERVLADDLPISDAAYADYAVFRKADGGGNTWNAVLNGDTATLSDEWKQGEGADASLVITDLRGTPLLTVTLDGNKTIIGWQYS